MFTTTREVLRGELERIEADGLYKRERVITTPQQPSIGVASGDEVLNLCANNYLGLADDPRIVAAAKDALDRWGYGLASVRFICGTQQIHRQLEERLSQFLGTEDTILYGSCFDANGGLFETLLGAEDAVISDELNHASIIDGVRLCRAQRLRYRNRDMADLAEQLRAATGARRRLIATDGVFSMDGYVAPLGQICDLAEEFDAMVMVDDSHAVGVVGERGRGTPELLGVADRVDIVTGTLGKALGGASGGYTSGRREIVELLRQRLPALPVLQLGGTGGRRSLPRRARPPRAERRPEGAPARQHELVPGPYDRARLRRAGRRSPDRADHDRRRRRRHPNGGPAAREGRLRHRLQLPGRPARDCPHPHPGLGRPYERRPRAGAPSPLPTCARSWARRRPDGSSGRAGAHRGCRRPLPGEEVAVHEVLHTAAGEVSGVAVPGPGQQLRAGEL